MVSTEQGVFERALFGNILQAGPMQQTVGIKRVPDAAAFAESKADRFTARAYVLAIRRQLRSTLPIFAGQVFACIDAICRHVGIEFERLHMQRHGDVIANAL